MCLQHRRGKEWGVMLGEMGRHWRVLSRDVPRFGFYVQAPCGLLRGDALQENRNESRQQAGAEHIVCSVSHRPAYPLQPDF